MTKGEGRKNHVNASDKFDYVCIFSYKIKIWE